MIRIRDIIYNIVFIPLMGLVLYYEYLSYRKKKGLGNAIVRVGLPFNFYLLIGLMWIYYLYQSVSIQLQIGLFDRTYLILLLMNASLSLIFVYRGLQQKIIWEGGISAMGNAWKWEEVVSYEFVENNIIGYERPIIVFNVQVKLFKKFVRPEKWWISPKDEENIKALLEKHLPGKYDDADISM